MTPALVPQSEIGADAARRGRRRRVLRRVVYYTAFAIGFANSFLLFRRLRPLGADAHSWLAYAALVMMLAAFCLWAVDVAGFFRRWRRHATGRCPHCGYDLRSCGARCSECGLERRVVRSFGQYATRT